MTESEDRKQHGRGGVEYENVGSEYMEERQLQEGAAGWVLLAGLGVAFGSDGTLRAMASTASAPSRSRAPARPSTRPLRPS